MSFVFFLDWFSHPHLSRLPFSAPAVLSPSLLPFCKCPGSVQGSERRRPSPLPVCPRVTAAGDGRTWGPGGSGGDRAAKESTSNERQRLNNYCKMNGSAQFRKAALPKLPSSSKCCPEAAVTGGHRAASPSPELSSWPGFGPPCAWSSGLGTRHLGWRDHKGPRTAQPEVQQKENFSPTRSPSFYLLRRKGSEKPSPRVSQYDSFPGAAFPGLPQLLQRGRDTAVEIQACLSVSLSLCNNTLHTLGQA